MRILLLCEGDGESWSSWSGITRSLVDHLRLAGHTVDVGNVDVQSADRWIAAIATFSPRRSRWGTRYHLGGVPFRLRSRRAKRLVEVRGTQSDVVLQIGATFHAAGSATVPYCLCCDSNILMAGRGVASGYSDAARLTSDEVAAVAEREAVVYRGAAALFPLSERLRRSFVEDFGVRSDRVRAIYAGPNLDPSRLPVSQSFRTANEHPPTILFVGLQFERKGGDLLLRSFRKIRRHLPHARLILAGVPVGFVTEPGVVCLGVLDRNRPAEAAALAEAYASADVFAMPTRFEPFGIAFVEAMHFGLPCVGPRAWAVPEIIADGETGFTVPAEDVETLTDRLLRLLRAPSLARTMGAQGRRKAQRLFTWPLVIERMMAVLTAVVASSNGHAARGSNGRNTRIS